MSEYQYYEFQAIDRPLTANEMSLLRGYSTRARISPTRFVNDYSWGDFKGDEDGWMERYFDAFLYFTNWGTRILQLRLPAKLLGLDDARRYCVGEGASVRKKGAYVVLRFASDYEGGDGWDEEDDEQSKLSSMISVRADLARGDLRALYLGWLACAQSGELDDDDHEPPVPPGLGKLSASLEAMAMFLRIDPDLLAVAAAASAPRDKTGPSRKEVLAGLAMVPASEKDALLARLAIDDDHASVRTELLRRLRADAGSRATTVVHATRTIGALLAEAEDLRTQREELETRRTAAAKARQDRAAAAARVKHLDGLVGKEAKLWADAEALIATKLPRSYDAALALLVDLRDLAARGNGDDYRVRLDALRARHAKKPSFLERLVKAGLATRSPSPLVGSLFASRAPT